MCRVDQITKARICPETVEYAREGIKVLFTSSVVLGAGDALEQRVQTYVRLEDRANRPGALTTRGGWMSKESTPHDHTSYCASPTPITFPKSEPLAPAPIQFAVTVKGSRPA